MAQVDRELDISVNTLHGWIKQYKKQNPSPFAQEIRLDSLDERDLRELQKRIRDLKKGDAYLRKRPEVKYSFIHEHRFDLRVEKMCQVFEVSRSGYYAWLDRTPSERKKRRETDQANLYRVPETLWQPQNNNESYVPKERRFLRKRWHVSSKKWDSNLVR